MQGDGSGERMSTYADDVDAAAVVKEAKEEAARVAQEAVEKAATTVKAAAVDAAVVVKAAAEAGQQATNETQDAISGAQSTIDTTLKNLVRLFKIVAVVVGMVILLVIGLEIQVQFRNRSVDKLQGSVNTLGTQVDTLQNSVNDLQEATNEVRDIAVEVTTPNPESDAQIAELFRQVGAIYADCVERGACE